MNEEIRKYQNRIWELSKQVERYRVALEFYAVGKNYCLDPETYTSKMTDDFGAKAREALDPKDD